jgi:hypothetical protein
MEIKTLTVLPFSDKPTNKQFKVVDQDGDIYCVGSKEGCLNYIDLYLKAKKDG